MGEPSPSTTPPERASDDRLDSWKEIAAYLDRDVTTVQRWEKREAMPVHRHLHDKRGSVYALTPELDAWIQSRRQHLEEEEEEEERAPEAVAAPGDGAPRARVPARYWLVLAGLAVLGVLAVAYILSRGRADRAAQPEIRSLAVLPLKNLSGDPAAGIPGRWDDGRTHRTPGPDPGLARDFPHVGNALQESAGLGTGDCENSRCGRHCRRVGDAGGQPDSRHGPADSRSGGRALLVGNLRSRAERRAQPRKRSGTDHCGKGGGYSHRRGAAKACRGASRGTSSLRELFKGRIRTQYKQQQS